MKGKQMFRCTALLLRYLFGSPLGVLVFLFLLEAPLFAAQSLRVGIYENNPKIFTSESGEPAGIFVDIIEAIAALEGWRIEYVRGTWSEGLDRLGKGEIDLMPDVAYTSERSELFAYHEEPALSDWFQIYARQGSGIRGLPDLDGKRVSILDRSIQQEVFQGLIRDFGFSITFLPFSEYTNVFSAVSEGKADAAVTNRFFGAAHMHRYNLEDTAVIFNPTRLFFAASKSTGPAILRALDKNLNTLKKDPESAYFRSLKKWTSEDVSAFIPQWLKRVAIVLGALALLGGAMSLLLKRQIVSRTAELTHLFDNAPLGLFFSGWDGKIKKANAEGLRMLGFSEREIVGEVAEKFIVHRGKEEVFSRENATEAMPSQSFHGEGKRKDGSTVPLSCVAFPLILSGKNLGFYTVFRNVSLQMANEKKIDAIIRDLNRTVSTLKKSWEQIVHVLVNVSEARDPYTAGHQRHVAKLARAMAEEMGMDKKKARQVELAALIHDIGKIEVPAEILSKPGKLSDIEYRIIQTHPAAAHRILQPIEVPWALAEVVYQHHERMDGSGYPQGLRGSDILMEARIISVADTVEAMSFHRPYRAAKGIDAALDEVTANRGRFYDLEAVDACLRLFKEKEFTFEDNAG